MSCKARVRSLLRLRGLHQDLDRRNRELRTAYNDLRDLQNQLVQAEKMSSLGQLIAGLAHEINNSINAVYNGIRPLATTIKRVEQLVETPAPGESHAGDCRPNRDSSRIPEDLDAGQRGRSRSGAHGQDHQRPEDVFAPGQRRLPGIRLARSARHVRESSVEFACAIGSR